MASRHEQHERAVGNRFGPSERGLLIGRAWIGQHARRLLACGQQEQAAERGRHVDEIAVRPPGGAHRHGRGNDRLDAIGTGAARRHAAKRAVLPEAEQGAVRREERRLRPFGARDREHFARLEIAPHQRPAGAGVDGVDQRPSVGGERGHLNRARRFFTGREGDRHFDRRRPGSRRRIGTAGAAHEQREEHDERHRERPHARAGVTRDRGHRRWHRCWRRDWRSDRLIGRHRHDNFRAVRRH